MQCTELNAMLIEHFANLERLCNQIYGTHHGVNSYINEMENTHSTASAIIPGWRMSLLKLKDVRHKRNQLSHGEVPFSSQYATEDDINFLIDFRSNILGEADPLTLYRKHSPVSTSSAPAQQSFHQPVYTQSCSNRKHSGCLTAVLLFILLFICTILFLF